MARPRTFEKDEVLDAAMQTFWAQGYESTSMADLMDSMGLQKGSIYKAFGDKHSLFLEALRRYVDGFYGRAVQLFEELPPAKAVHAWIEHGQTFCKGSMERRGCLFFNTLVELAPHDEEVRRTMHQQWKRMMALLAGAIEKAQEQGEFRRDVPAKRLAHYIAQCSAGAAATSKGSFPGLESENLTDLILGVLAPTAERGAATPD